MIEDTLAPWKGTYLLARVLDLDVSLAGGRVAQHLTPGLLHHFQRHTQTEKQNT